VLATRKAAWVRREPTVKSGYLAFYAQHVAPACQGAVMPR
jgi:dihydroxy-acid dehydratase